MICYYLSTNPFLIGYLITVNVFILWHFQPGDYWVSRTVSSREDYFKVGVPEWVSFVISFVINFLFYFIDRTVTIGLSVELYLSLLEYVPFWNVNIPKHTLYEVKLLVFQYGVSRINVGYVVQLSGIPSWTLVGLTFSEL